MVLCSINPLWYLLDLIFGRLIILFLSTDLPQSCLFSKKRIILSYLVEKSVFRLQKTAWMVFIERQLCLQNTKCPSIQRIMNLIFVLTLQKSHRKYLFLLSKECFYTSSNSCKVIIKPWIYMMILKRILIYQGAICKKKGMFFSMHGDDRLDIVLYTSNFRIFKMFISFQQQYLFTNARHPGHKDS